MTNAPTWVEICASGLFLVALLHTFSVQFFNKQAQKYREGSVGENFFHLLGEVEVVFGFWAGIFLLFLCFLQGTQASIDYVQGRNFTEPVFVFVVMTVCSTKPFLTLVNQLIEFFARLIPLNKATAFYISALIVGPLLGSFITEPAAMTVTALVLLDRFYSKNISPKFMYATLGLLFVNVSIGGTLTPFAAPPVIMVAGKWGWDLQHMILNFGWKGVLSCVLSTLLVVYRFRNNLSQIHFQNSKSTTAMAIPLWVSILHLIILAMIVVTAHYMAVFVGFFLLFLGVASVTREYQTELKLKEGLLVAFFLAGIVVLGGPQQWWLEPLLGKLSTATLYLGAIGLTAVTDNAALTYLGSLVPTLSDESKYFLVAGAVVGGGLTVIANAPNPAGYGILNSSFGENGISPVSLFLAALPPTLIAAACFWFL